MKNGVTVVTDHVSRVMEGLRLLSHTRVMVGVPQEKNARSESGLTNAEIGYIHENGAPEVNIPARPHLVPGVRNVQDKLLLLLEKAEKAALEGRPNGALQALHAAGLTAQAAVRAKITSGPFVPLAPSTLAGRRRKGRKGTKPLLDTTQYRSSISYVLRRV